MTSKKTAASKRAGLPRSSDYTKTFLKDWQRLSHSGRYDMHRLKEAMVLLVSNEGPLPTEWLDHALRVPHWGRFFADLQTRRRNSPWTCGVCSQWYAFGAFSLTPHWLSRLCSRETTAQCEFSGARCDGPMHEGFAQTKGPPHGHPNNSHRGRAIPAWRPFSR
jgi:hypothetical protein